MILFLFLDHSYFYKYVHLYIYNQKLEKLTYDIKQNKTKNFRYEQ